MIYCCLQKHIECLRTRPCSWPLTSPSTASLSSCRRPRPFLAPGQPSADCSSCSPAKTNLSAGWQARQHGQTNHRTGQKHGWPFWTGGSAPESEMSSKTSSNAESAAQEYLTSRDSTQPGSRRREDSGVNHQLPCRPLVSPLELLAGAKASRWQVGFSWSSRARNKYQTWLSVSSGSSTLLPSRPP
jgi:hypothetical protein